MKRRARLRILITTNVAVWVAAGWLLSGKHLMAAKQPATVTLETDPPVVRILVKGDRTYGMTYMETPAKLTLQPGKRRLRIMREGYVTYDNITVDVGAGETIPMGKITLEKDPQAVFAGMAIRPETSGKDPKPDKTGTDPQTEASPGEGGIYFEVDDTAIFRGTAPAETSELVANVERTLNVFPLWPSRDGRVRCRFVLTEQHVQAPLQIRVKRVKGKGGKADTVKVTPCDKVKDKK